MRIVNITEVNGEQAVFNNKYSGSFTAQIVNGEVEVCDPGCSDCDCTACMEGYVLDSSTGSCRKCGIGCSGCTVDAPTTCTGCMAGSFLNASNLC